MWPREIDLKITQRLDLADEDLKAASINMIKDLKERMVLVRKQMGMSGGKKKPNYKNNLNGNSRNEKENI